MLVVSALAVVAVLTFGFDHLIDKRRNPNEQPITQVSGGVHEVILDANRQDHYVATAVINGLDVEVLVDTGATQIAVSESLARRLRLERGPAFQVSTASGVALAYGTSLDSVQLGNIVRRDVRASIVPGMQAPDVLLGMNFLKDLEMTQRDGRLILRDHQTRSE
jgi:aspartyl protease family protein